MNELTDRVQSEAMMVIPFDGMSRCIKPRFNDTFAECCGGNGQAVCL